MASAKERGLNILSFDGGGVRGLSSIISLERIMHRMNSELRKAGREAQKPHQVFDLIGGTSTGGLLAIMLGRLHMDARECRVAYEELMEKCFDRQRLLPLSLAGRVRSLYSSDALRKSIISILKTRGIGEKEPFLDNSQDPCRVFVCATAKSTAGLTILRSYSIEEEHETEQYSIVQAAMATCAAPPFFDAVTIGKCHYIDGALKANNPVLQAVNEARKIWCSHLSTDLQDDIKDHVKCLISIGTGDPGKVSITNKVGAMVTALVRIATEAKGQSQTFRLEWSNEFRQKRAFRFNVEQGLQDVTITEFNQIDRIERSTIEYLNESEVHERLRDCVNALLNDVRRKKLDIPSMISFFDPKPDIFTERKTLLDQVEAALPRHDCHKGSKDVLILHGISGSGKTELALHYWRKNSKHFSTAFKISARSEEEFLQGLLEIHASISPQFTVYDSINHSAQTSETMQIVLQWLNQANNNYWLLVIDDVGSAPESSQGDWDGNTPLHENVRSRKENRKNSFLEKFIGKLKQGSIIVISQYEFAIRSGARLHVPELEESESHDLLKQAIRDPSRASENVLRHLSTCLSNHTLAIAAAATYIKTHEAVDCEEYIRRWNECDPGLWDLEHGSLLNQSLRKSLKLAFDSLSEQAQRLLLLCGIIDDRDIWFELFGFNNRGIHQTNHLAPDLPTFERLIDETTRAGLTTAKDASRCRELRGFSIHPVFHKILQLIVRREPSTLKKITNTAIKMVGLSLSSLTGTVHHADLARHYPHAIRCYLAIQTLDDESLTVRWSALPYLGEIGNLLWDMGSSEYAKSLYDRVVNEYDGIPQVKEKEKEHFYKILNSRALILRMEGDYRSAQEDFTRVLGYINCHYESEALRSVYRADVLLNLGIAYRMDQKLDDANQKIQQALSEQQKHYKENEPRPVSHWRTLRHLGETYIHQGRLSEAKEILERVRAGFRNLLDHKADKLQKGSRRTQGYRTNSGSSNICQLDMAYLAQSFAHVYRRQEKFVEAFKELENARTGIEKLCGADSECSIENLWYQVQTLRDQVEKQGGDQGELCQAFEVLIARYRYRLGSTHHRTLQAIGAFGRALVRMGKCCEARVYLLEVSEGYNHKGGTYDKAVVLQYIAKSYLREANAQESGQNARFALKYFDKVLRLMESKQINCNREWVALKQDTLISRAQAVILGKNKEESVQALKMCLDIENLEDNNRKWAERRMSELVEIAERA